MVDQNGDAIPDLGYELNHGGRSLVLLGVSDPCAVNLV
jgi:hypothetical protein